MPHNIPHATKAKIKSDKANGVGVRKLLYECRDRIQSAMSKGLYTCTVFLHSVDLDDQQTVMDKLKILKYSVVSSRRGAAMEVSWK